MELCPGPYRTTHPMATTLPRSAGVLLHPTSLPGPFGIGDLGPTAYRWVETLAHMKQSWWQVLPLGPTGVGDSPYQSYSAFAGSVNLLSPELLEQDGLVHGDLWAGRSFPEGAVDYAAATAFKAAVVRAAWESFRAGRAAHLRADFDAYCGAEAGWLDEYARFMAIRESIGGVGLNEWPADLFRREPAALAAAEKRLADEIRMHRFGQFLFHRQWTALKDYAASRGVKVIGDAPIFVARDSADVWANPHLFLLDANLKPKVVAGVPPDYFAADGQLWGNPLYDWDRMAGDGYAWWIARFRHAIRQVDLVRLDHFRGFAAAWNIPAGDKTARHGKWVPGPGVKLFAAANAALGTLPLIAEDLGIITPDVDAMRTAFGLPGMSVLQFMLGAPDNRYWPHNFDPNTVCYPGTHDNDTTNGWFAGIPEDERRTFAKYLGRIPTDAAWELIRMAWGSVAVLAVAPLQDVFGLGTDGRMNKPGVVGGNWRWRFKPQQFRRDLLDRLADLTAVFNRAPAAK
jgi:4-alpha-glucanotransferase